MARRPTDAWVLVAAALATCACNMILSVEEKKYDGTGASSGVGGASGGGGSDAGAHGLGDASWICTPATCESINADCGKTGDGCGDLISCGECPSDQICGAAAPNRCGVGQCVALTCAKLGATCGSIGDGCGNALDCGTCTSPKTCGGAGQANQCGCTPTTCAAEGKNCGTIPDKCGTTLDCGSCTAPSSCGGLGTPNVCGCSPAACPPIYDNSFESAADFQTGSSGWLVWQYCFADASAWRAGYGAACNGGQYDLRLHTTDFVPGCTSPGLYALSPSVPAQAGRVYRVETWSRNSSAVGSTLILFYDTAAKQISSGSVAWGLDAWQCGPDPILEVTSPAGTTSLRIRLELHSQNSYADIDLLKVYLEP